MKRFVKRVGVCAFLVLLFLLWAYPEWLGSMAQPTVSAKGETVTIRDGDTLTIGAGDFRLHGIDAPEFAQICTDGVGAQWACGKIARAALVELVKGHAITCEVRAHDKYGRSVATCRDETARDLSRAMAERGLAVSFGGFGEGPYADEEAEAKAAKRGIWQGQFDPPSSWREAHPRAHIPK